MNCPVCKRENAVPLSVCPTCGTMINDSERIELAKTISVVKNFKREVNKTKMPSESPLLLENAVSEKPPVAPRTPTASLNAKATSPTLVEFHNKNSTLPEWRLQLQNAVRQRQGGEQSVTAPTSVTATASPKETPVKPARQKRLATSGANALKAETAPQPARNHPEVARALQRIEEARQKFLVAEEAETQAQTAPPAKAAKNYPFYIAAKTSDAEIKPPAPNRTATEFSKPKLAAAAMQRIEERKLDTNKLPPLAKVIQDSPDAILRAASTVVEEIKIEEIAPAEKVITKTEAAVETVEVVEIVEIVEVEENATFAMRFNAGLFDLIIGAFTSAVLLAPFMLSSGNWLSWTGLFAFVATTAVVMFIYLTTTVGLYGRTFGMRLFSLELVDIEGENYPTFHQAAVNSSVYLLSLACFGLGFLTVLFNEEKRAVHDLVSGTVVVREEEES